MFIQTQQTSSVNGSSSSSSSSSNNTVHHHSKKRKLEYNVSQPVIQHALVQSTGDYQLDNTGLQQRYSVNGANTAFSSLHNNNALQKSSPNQQTLVRASTIKLLDTYQRCGQKVGATSSDFLLPIILFWPAWSRRGKSTYPRLDPSFSWSRFHYCRRRTLVVRS